MIRMVGCARNHPDGEVFLAISDVVHSGWVIWTKLYPKSVGASVDKVFVLVCSPMKLSSAESWLKNIQAL